MTPEDLRAIIAYLRDRVQLGSGSDDTPIVIEFHPPTSEDIISAKLNAGGMDQIRKFPWWEEMATDIIETPDYCEPDDSPQQVLEYARDVVTDYLRKRVSLDSA